MKIIKTYKYKLRLTNVQRRSFDQWLGSCRYLYNIGLHQRILNYKEVGKSISYHQQAKELVQCKKEEELSWLKQVPSQTLQGALEQLDRSYQKFFNGLKSGRTVGFPKFAAKHRFNSFVIKSVKRDNHNRIIIPKMGSIKYYNSRELKGKLKRATIIKESDGWYVSIVSEVDHISTPAIESQEVGLDFGVARFYTLSNGDWVENPRFFQKYKEQKTELQQSLAKKKKGSHNWLNVKRQLNKLESKIARSRKDWQHKLSTNLVRRYNGIFIEKLNIKNMTKRTKPKLAEDGKTYLSNNGAAKSGLNRSMLDLAPSQFAGMIECKCNWEERLFAAVNPKNTSRECSECSHISKENRKTQAQFKCVACGFECNADENAGKNIKGRGYTSLQSLQGKSLAA